MIKKSKTLILYLMITSVSLSMLPSCARQKEPTSSPDVPVFNPTPSPTIAPTATSISTATVAPSPTATATAAALPSQTPAMAPAIEPLRVNLLQSIPVGKERSIFSAMDDQYIYWIRQKDPANMFRMPLNGGTAQKVITTKYAQGSIEFLTYPILTDHWVIFGDTPNDRSLKDWIIRAVNTDNFSEKIILQSIDNSIAILDFSMDADEGILIWSQQAIKSGKFAEDMVLKMDLNQGTSSELFRAEGDQAPWAMVKISKGRVVAEQDQLNSTGADNNIYYFDPTQKQPLPLTANGQSSMPGFSYPWVIWKSAPRFEFGQKITIHNLENGQEWVLPLLSVSNQDPKINGHFVYWTGASSEDRKSYTAYIYNILNQTTYRLPPAENRYVKNVVIHGQMIAWLRIENFQLADSDAYLEWGILDNSIN